MLYPGASAFNIPEFTPIADFLRFFNKSWRDQNCHCTERIEQTVCEETHQLNSCDCEQKRENHLFRFEEKKISLRERKEFPSREHIGKIDDSLMLSSIKQACSLKKQQSDIDASSV